MDEIALSGLAEIVWMGDLIRAIREKVYYQPELKFDE